jgi:hypothetical protein
MASDLLLSNMRRIFIVMLNVLFLNNNIEAKEAAAVLNCSYEYLIDLVKKKKIRGEKINNQWFLNPSDCYRFKNQAHGLSKNRQGQTHFLSRASTQRFKDLDLVVKIKGPSVTHIQLKDTVKLSIYQKLDQKIDDIYKRLADLK